jgi:iron complex outermembrane recepter protein
MNPHVRRALCAASPLALVVAAQPAFADQAAPAGAGSPTSPDAQNATAPGSTDIANTIVVSGIRAALRDSLKAKRVSSLVVEEIGSKDIGVMPDVTIADELDRAPGVNTTRDRGNASQASVRGLGPRLVLGLVNGREVASSEPDRNVRWEIYPSEDVSAVTIYKSQDAGLIAGGVAATIDIHTLRPLDYTGPVLVARAGALYGTGGKDIPGYSGLGERGSLQYIGKITSNFAITVGGSYQRQKNGRDSFQGWNYNLANTSGYDAPTLNGSQVNAPYGAQTEIDATTETRWSSAVGLQWKPSPDWDINGDLLYSDVKIAEPQLQQWYGSSNGWGDWGGTIGAAGDIYQPGNYKMVGNDIVAATLNNYSSVTNLVADYNENKTLLATGLNARYHGDHVTLKLDGSYSRAVRTNSWMAIASTTYPETVSFNTAANVTPTVSESADPAVPGQQSFSGYSVGAGQGPAHLEDTLGAFQADLERKFDTGFLTAVSAGFRYANRIKSLSTGYETVVANANAPAVSEFSVSAFSVPSLDYGNFNQMASVTSYSTSGDPTAYWRVKENDYEGYAKVDFASRLGTVPFSGNIGVRMVGVDDKSSAFQTYTYWDANADNGAGANVTGATPTVTPNHYFRVLPSLNLTFTFSDDLLLHAGVAEVMSRPPIDELRGAQILSDYTGYHAGSTGNPTLRPFMATQGDLSLEWYFHKEALLAVAGYYKKVSTNIGYTQTTETITTAQDSAPYTITKPVNGNGGDVYGSEVTFQTPFYWIKGGEHFGIYSNAALVGSNLREMTPVLNPLSAVGMANFTGEADLWAWGHGFDLRVGLKHHSPYTVIFGWDASQLIRLESETTLQASISYTVNKQITVRLQAWNLTNAASRYYFNNDPNQIARYEKYGASYMADVTFKY